MGFEGDKYIWVIIEDMSKQGWTCLASIFLVAINSKLGCEESFMTQVLIPINIIIALNF